MTVTNDAEAVIKDLYEQDFLWEGRRLWYYDSDIIILIIALMKLNILTENLLVLRHSMELKRQLRD